MVSEDLKSRLMFVAECDKLKNILRVNLLSDGTRRENTAEHSWHMATMVLVLKDYAEGPIDLLKAMKMALLHDVVEIDAGDTYAFDQAAHNDKAERETLAAKRLFGLLPAPLNQELKSIWEEYEEADSPEAKFVQAIDRLNPFMQHMGNKGIIWRERAMTKGLLLTRMDTIRRFAPKLWPYLEESMSHAIAQGWLDPS